MDVVLLVYAPLIHVLVMLHALILSTAFNVFVLLVIQGLNVQMISTNVLLLLVKTMPHVLMVLPIILVYAPVGLLDLIVKTLLTLVFLLHVLMAHVIILED